MHLAAPLNGERLRLRQRGRGFVVAGFAGERMCGAGPLEETLISELYVGYVRGQRGLGRPPERAGRDIDKLGVILLEAYPFPSSAPFGSG